MRTIADLVSPSLRNTACYTRQEGLAAYLSDADHVSSSTLRRFARGSATPHAGFVEDGSQRLPQALHAALLEPGRFACDYFALDSTRVEECDEKSDLLERIWLSSAEHAALLDMRAAIRSYPRAPLSAWLESGMRELSIYWTDEQGGRWKARPDCFTPDLILELKTTQDVRPALFARTRARFGYDLQAAHYVDAVRTLTGRTPRFAFIAIEPRAPHYVWLHELAPAEIAAAGARLATLRQAYLGCEVMPS